jgi:hypothetical protein
VQQAHIIVKTCDQGNVKSTRETKVHPSLFLDAKVKANREYNDYCHPLNRARHKECTAARDEFDRFFHSSNLTAADQ